MTLAVLPHFPFVNQLEGANAPPDGHPPENARYDCVPASLAAAIMYYDGGVVSPDALKDAEYGQTYANAGTSLKRYIDDASDLARAKYHITCVPYNNTNTVGLVGRIHTWLRQGYPVIATIPSQWGTAHDMATLAHPPFSTHVICFYSEVGGLTAMNPWGGFAHTGSDAYWQGRLCEGQVWAVVREAVTAMATIPTGWKDDGTTLTAPNGVPVVHGFREYVLTHSWAANNTPLAPEQHIAGRSLEYGNPAIGPGARQDFHYCSLGWTTKTNVYVIAVGQDIGALATQAATLTAQVTSLTAQLAAAKAAQKPDPVAEQWLAIGNAIKSGIGEL